MKPSTKIAKFMTPVSGVQGSRVGAIWSYNQNVLNLRKFSSLLPYIYFSKTKCMSMMSMKPSTKIVKCMTSVSGVQALGWGQYGHIVQMY